MDNLKKLWDSTILSYEKTSREEAEINSKLLSRLLIFLLPVSLMYLLTMVYLFGNLSSFLPDVMIFGGLLGFLIVAYWVNQKGYFKTAIFSILLVGGMAIFFEALIDHDVFDLSFLSLPIIIAGLLLERKHILLISLLYMVEVAVIAFLFSYEEQSLIVRYILPLLSIGILLNFVARIHRDHLEAVRNEKLASSEFRYALVDEAVNDGLWDWDYKKNKVYYSVRWKSMLGYQSDEIGVMLAEWLDRIHPEDGPLVQRAIMEHIKNTSPHFHMEYRILHADGTYRWMLSRGLAVRDVQGDVIRMAGSQSDIHERKLAEEKLTYSALHDALTGLPNRTLFMDRLKQSVEISRRHPERRVGVLYLDLDRFKLINDSLGHSIGDKFLISNAHAIQACLRPEDTVARMGGDEFAILVNNITGVNDCIQVAERIQKRLMQTTVPLALSQSASVSIGITLVHQNYKDLQDILRDADSAMYRAKELGGGRYQVFDHGMYENAMSLLKLEVELKQAIENWEWQVHYQPILSVRSGEIIGVEALVRWLHPRRGIILPSEFIAVAEETGLIVMIDEFVLQTACEEIKAIQELGHPDLFVSVNISGHQFQNRHFIDMVRQALAKTGLPSHSLVLEITEGIAMRDLNHSIRVLRELNAMGIQTSLDDFGIGYSSLSYLKRMPIQVLKVDQSFIKDVGDDSKGEAILEAIISLGHTLNLLVVAEGVETSEQFAFLNSKFCDAAQGFLFSKGITAKELQEALKNINSFAMIKERLQLSQTFPPTYKPPHS